LPIMHNFHAKKVATPDGCDVFISQAGSGTPVLLLHGFPQTGLMWRDVAPRLAERHLVTVADLPGYGRSGCPNESPDHSHMSKRNMADILVAAMNSLGHDQFAVVGHDRGARVAYRMALDHPKTITKAAVFDVIPTFEAWERAEAKFALAYWPFAMLAQPQPLPEQILATAAAAVVDDALSNWGTRFDVFTCEVRDAYIGALSDPERAHCICEEYRAAATIDRHHDEADLANARHIKCPLLVLWSASGALASLYELEGGPLAIWPNWADDVCGEALPWGHFFPEEAPEATGKRLLDFLGDR
jgi:haloacetate dehalogenase